MLRLLTNRPPPSIIYPNRANRAIQKGSTMHPVKNNCEWFNMCHRKASTVRTHPVRGEVPICEECNSYMEKRVEDSREEVIA